MESLPTGVVVSGLVDFSLEREEVLIAAGLLLRLYLEVGEAAAAEAEEVVVEAFDVVVEVLVVVVVEEGGLKKSLSIIFLEVELPSLLPLADFLK